jgi:hypothetical protein
MSIARAPATAQPSPSGATGRGRVLCRSYGAWIGHRGRAVYRHGAPAELCAGAWGPNQFRPILGRMTRIPFVTGFTRIFHTRASPVISSGALARCQEAFKIGQLFSIVCLPQTKAVETAGVSVSRTTPG